MTDDNAADGNLDKRNIWLIGAGHTSQHGLRKDLCYAVLKYIMDKTYNKMLVIRKTYFSVTNYFLHETFLPGKRSNITEHRKGVKKLHIFFNRRENEKREIVEQIILEKYNQYYRVAYSYTHKEADACDIVQNGAYKALRGSSSLEKPEYASTWVYRIMLNECFRYMKQPQNLSYEYIRDEMGAEPSYTENYGENLDIRQALDSLPEQDKAVIVLRFFEDMKLEEIADILAENLNTVKSRLYRSIKKLRSVLEEHS